MVVEVSAEVEVEAAASREEEAEAEADSVHVEVAAVVVASAGEVTEDVVASAEEVVSDAVVDDHKPRSLLSLLKHTSHGFLSSGGCGVTFLTLVKGSCGRKKAKALRGLC